MGLFESMALAVALAIASPMTGSFLKCWADRAAVGKSVADGRSYCDHCGQTLAARDLVPILSWIWNRGKSRCCGKPISPTLLSAEVTAMGLAASALLVLPQPFWLLGVATAWLLQAAVLHMLTERRLAVLFVILLTALGLLATWQTGGDRDDALLAAGAGAVIGMVVQVLAPARGTPAVLLAPAGAYLGIFGLLTVLPLALGYGLMHRVWAQITTGGKAAPALSVAMGLAAGVWTLWLFNTAVAG